MSAAQPADPAHPHTQGNVNGPEDAAVLPLKPRRGPRDALKTVRGRWSHMGNTPPGRHLHTAGDTDQQPDNDVTALTEFASSIETSFLEIGQSLTDPATAATFQRTLDVWARLLEGSHAQGVIDDAQLVQLLETLHGMRKAPTLL